MKIAALAFLFFALAYPAEACHRFSIWKYPYAQRCSTRVAQSAMPIPPPKPNDLEPKALEFEGQKAPDIPLPSLKDMQFPPDCDADWCQRMKGIGLLRQRFGTN